MEAVLDTVSLQHMLRNTKLNKVKSEFQIKTCLDSFLKTKMLVLAFDDQKGLVSEWGKTCGFETISVIITKWEEIDAIIFFDKLPKINVSIRKKLRHMGFIDTIDKLILRISLATNDKIVISDDNHFWDPSSTSGKGNQNAPVTKLCKEELEIKITLLIPLMRTLTE